MVWELCGVSIWGSTWDRKLSGLEVLGTAGGDSFQRQLPWKDMRG